MLLIKHVWYIYLNHDSLISSFWNCTAVIILHSRHLFFFPLYKNYINVLIVLWKYKSVVHIHAPLLDYYWYFKSAWHIYQVKFCVYVSLTNNVSSKSSYPQKIFGLFLNHPDFCLDGPILTSGWKDKIDMIYMLKVNHC